MAKLGAEDTEGMEILAERVPPPSQANDALVIGTAVAAAVCGVGFAAVLLTDGPLPAQGALLSLSLLLFAVAVRRYFTDRFPDIDAAQPRFDPAEDADSPPIARIEPVVGRRPLLTRVLTACAGVLGLAFLAPAASLGPTPGRALRTTAWRRGRRLVTTEGSSLTPEGIAPGGVVTAWPEGAIGDEPTAVLVFRLTSPPQPPTIAAWVVDETVVAYSKICTHAGCPVALYRERDNALFCPCHQSTFDVRRGAVPTFGPAARALPQLPLGVDGEGRLVALMDFTEQVGPAFG